jgi:TonB-dependent SusC/RagA subfamily outer membrane receptor
MKKLILVFLAMSMLPLSLIAQSDRNKKTSDQSSMDNVIKSDSTGVSAQNCDSSKNYQQPVLIRSANGRQPLIIIDGVVSNQGTLGLDPNSIKSVSVLKDTSAVNVYGDKARDGAILITTKKKII